MAGAVTAVAAPVVAAAAARGWDAWWYAPVAPARLDLLRRAVVLYAAADLALVRAPLRHLASDARFADPVLLLRVTGLPRLAGVGLVVAHVTTVLALLAAGRRRAVLAIGAAGYLWLHATLYSYGEVSNSRTAVAVALVVLATVPSRRNAEVAGWALRALLVLLVYLYVFAGVSKLLAAGPGWWQGGALAWGLLDGGMPAGAWVLQHAASALPVLALAGWLLELAAPVLLVPGRARRAWAWGAIGFHGTVWVLLGLDFVGMALVCVATVTALDGDRR